MKERANQKIRTQIKQSGFYTYELAAKIGIHENTFFRMLRKELNDAEKRKVFKALEQLTSEQEMARKLRNLKE